MPRASSEHPQHSRIIHCGRFRLRYRGVPLVMGILNVTPDSFSDAGQFRTWRAAVAQGLRMADAGAAVLDVGGESSRPSAAPVTEREELRRVLTVIERLAKQVRIPVSIDTSKPEVARRALAVGASIVNDITALVDPRMREVVARSTAGVVLMHMQGTPRTMQRRPRYRHVVREVAGTLRKAVLRAERSGIGRARIIIDPGIGFGKTLKHNLALLREVKAMRRIGYPVLLGPSRKRFIGDITNSPVGERLAGTLACVAHAYSEGVELVRVHDVKPAVDLIRVLEAIDS